jgi:ABC-type multidrug transport system ATPase subunit
MIYLVLTLLSLLLGATEASNAISWNVSAIYTSKDGLEKCILEEVIGSARKGTIHAIMGPSGSGKSTVISILSGTVPKDSLSIFGEVHSRYTRPLFVAQDDLLFSQLTTSETLKTSVALKAKHSGEYKSQLSTTDDIINRLGLKKVAQSRVGDAKTRGLSGGEKKRLCVGNELIGSTATVEDDDGSSYALVYADEPTSGLDSFQALNVMKLFRELADDGNTIITAIHQPRASIYNMFDDITLLSEGSVMYSGSKQDMVPYFKALGYPCPAQTNPAEYYLDIISIDYSTLETEQESRERVHKFRDAFKKSATAAHIKTSLVADGLISSSAKDVKKSKQQAASYGTTKYRGGSMHPLAIASSLRSATRKTKTLFVRAWRTVTRDKALNIARFASSTFSALLFGAIYFRLGDGASTVPDRLGLLQVAAVNTAMTSLIKATTSFVQEKLIVNRERRVGSYSVFPYFFSKLVAEAPLSAFFPCFAGTIMYLLCGLNKTPGRLLNFLTILTVESFASSSLGMLVGSFASSVDSAIAIAPAVMVIFIVFGGLYVVNTPKWLSFIPKVSLIRWAYEALCVNEFDGLELIPEARFGPKSVSKGSEVLDSMGMGSSTVKNALIWQASIIAFNYAATLISLIRQKPSFEELQPAHESDQEKAKKIKKSGKDITEQVLADASLEKDNASSPHFKISATLVDADHHDDEDTPSASTSSSARMMSTKTAPGKPPMF